MRILIYSVNFSPEPIGKYSGEMAAWLADRGHEVRVIAAPPDYPEWSVEREHKWPAFRRERWHGIDVWRAPIWVPTTAGRFARAIHLLCFAMTSFPLMLLSIGWRPDVVLTVAPELLCAPAGLITAGLCGAKSWLHLQDFEVDVAFQMGLLKGRLLKRFLSFMERWMLRRFHTVSTISSRMVERLREKGVASERTCYFPNWVDARFRPVRKHGGYRAELGLDDSAVVALFSGTLGGKQGLMVIPAAARRLAARADIVFVVCADDVMKPRLATASNGLTNIRLIPLQPTERLPELLSTADIHLMPQSPDAADLVLPSKLSEMLASGRPVVATCRSESEIGEIVSQCGLAVPPRDSLALANAIGALADQPALRRDLGRRAREIAAARFDRDATLPRVFGSLEREPSDVADDAAA